MDSYLGSWRMAGNRTERIRGAVHEQYLYDECNRLLQIIDGADTVKNYTYDNSGNMLSDGEMSYLYDGFGRLEPLAINLERLVEMRRREMRGESKRQAELRRQLGAVQA